MKLIEQTSTYSGICFHRENKACFAVLISLLIFTVTGFSYLQHFDGTSYVQENAISVPRGIDVRADTAVRTEIVAHHKNYLSVSEHDSSELPDEHFNLDLSSMRQYFFLFRISPLSTFAEFLQEIKSHRSTNNNFHSLVALSYVTTYNLSLPNFIKEKSLYFRC